MENKLYSRALQSLGVTAPFPIPEEAIPLKQAFAFVQKHVLARAQTEARAEQNPC